LPTAPPLAGAIQVSMIPIDRLRPSRWNPNVMTAEQEAELLKEIRRLGRPPKPIVVRARGKRYEIVDGEHAWKAARACELQEVPCEIIDADDFEAQRQALTRNRHGENDPVKLGRLFQRMMQQRSLSQRGLGTEIDLSEGTIRNFVMYAEAATLRNSYAREHAEGRQVSADAEIAPLSVRQVRAYIELPEDQRDEWLDAGANIQDAEQPKSSRTTAAHSVDASQQPVHLHEPSHDAADEVEADQESEGSAAHSGTDGDEHATSVPPESAADQDESFDPGILDSLESHWQRANRPTRQKFLAGILAEPTMLAFARRIIKQGS
jgi:ParB/RepB/Spo0J family partition protein